MREDIMNDFEREETKKKNLFALKTQMNVLKEETLKIEKILKEEEEKNFKINKRYLKIAAVLLFLL